MMMKVSFMHLCILEIQIQTQLFFFPLVILHFMC